jgi:GGDEF domain-containing protein
MLSLDGFAERVRDAPQTQPALLAELERVTRHAVRDVDLVVPFAENQVLVFLPHTRREGAGEVAARLRGRLAQLESAPGLTASIGLAAYDPETKAEASFGSLLRDAQAALKKAQGSGGNRIEASEPLKRSRISIG